jgi:hypothetical protein
MLNLRFQFNPEKQKYAVAFSTKDNDFRILHVLQQKEEGIREILEENESILNHMGIGSYDVEIACFETLDDANVFMLGLNQDNYIKGKDQKTVGTTLTSDFPNAHVEYYIDDFDGRDMEMIFISTNHSYVNFKFEQMKYDSMNDNDVFKSHDFRMMMALVKPETDEEDYEQIDSEVLDSFNLEEVYPNKFHYKDSVIPYRIFELKNPDGKYVQYNIAKESFGDSLNLEDDDDLTMDGNFYYYVADEDFNLPAEELFEIIRKTDDYYTFLREL